MPSGPHNKMDELLRTYARKRREDAGDPALLHPATRRLLQAEAAKLRPRDDISRRTGWSWLLASWPRAAISVGGFAVLAVVVWNSLPERERAAPEFQLAKQDATYNAPDLSRDKDAASVGRPGVPGERDNDFSEPNRRWAPQPTAPNALADSGDVANRGLRADAELDDLKRNPETATANGRILGAPTGNAATKAASLEAQVALQSADSGMKEFHFAPGQAPADRFRIGPTSDDTLGAKLSLAPPPGPASERAGESLFILPSVTQTRRPTNAIYFSDSAIADGIGGGRGGLGGSKPGGAAVRSQITSPALALDTGKEELGRRFADAVSPQPGVPPATGGAGPGGRARFFGGLAAAEERAGANVTGATASGVLLAKDATQQPASPRSVVADDEIKSRVLLARQETLREARTAAIAPPPTAPLAVVPAPRPARPAATAAAPIDGLAVAPADGATFYRFRRQAETEGAIAAKNAPTPFAVLATFDFEQDGDRVRIIDSDGSVYAGRLLTTTEAREARWLELDGEAKLVPANEAERRKALTVDTAKQFPARLGGGRATAGTVFRVSGTNRASRQLITLEAALSGGDEAGSARTSFATKPAGMPPAPANRPLAAPTVKTPALLKTEVAPALTENPANQRLVGHLRIGAAGEVSIIAVPVTK